MRQFFTLHLLFLSLLVLTPACKNDAVSDRSAQDPPRGQSERRREMEQKAQVLLTASRTALQRQNFQAARDSIDTLRHRYYLAISAREQAILLLDSIELQEAQNELARIVDEDAATVEEACRKVKFYQRKLEHDLKPPTP